MYDHDLKVDGGYLAEDQTVPQNATAVGNGAGLEISNTQGGIEVVAIVTTEIGLADTKALTINLQQSSDNAVADAYAALATIYTVTASGATTVAVGTELANFVIPSNAERYIRASIVSTDAAGTGAVSIYPRYLPR